MRTIWKYEIKVGPDIQTHHVIPLGFKVVHVGHDPNGAACVWAEVDPEKVTDIVTFTSVGTGLKCPFYAVHRGTIIESDYVWHIYS